MNKEHYDQEVQDLGGPRCLLSNRKRALYDLIILSDSKHQKALYYIYPNEVNAVRRYHGNPEFEVIANEYPGIGKALKHPETGEIREVATGVINPTLTLANVIVDGERSGFAKADDWEFLNLLPTEIEEIKNLVKEFGIAIEV